MGRTLDGAGAHRQPESTTEIIRAPDDPVIHAIFSLVKRAVVPVILLAGASAWSVVHDGAILGMVILGVICVVALAVVGLVVYLR
jgi:hypothetical protein